MFDWDEANLRHIARHGVTPEEVEQVMHNDPTEATKQNHEGEERFFQLGFTNADRCLAVTTTWRGDRLRVVTAYPASSALRQTYFRRKRS